MRECSYRTSLTCHGGQSLRCREATAQLVRPCPRETIDTDHAPWESLYHSGAVQFIESGVLPTATEPAFQQALNVFIPLYTEALVAATTAAYACRDFWIQRDTRRLQPSFSESPASPTPVRAVRPYPRAPPTPPPADVVHRFRALALVAPDGTVYYGDDEARFDRLWTRPVAWWDDPELLSPITDTDDIVLDALNRNYSHRAYWRQRDQLRLSPTLDSVVTHVEDHGSVRHRRHRRRGHGSRIRNNARRNDRRVAARLRKLAQLVDFHPEPDMSVDL